MARECSAWGTSAPRPDCRSWKARRCSSSNWADNQLNNSLVFPGLFRGVLDVRARSITDGMARMVAQELARFAESRSIHDDDILPHMDEWEVFPRVAAAAGVAAQEDGVALLSKSWQLLHAEAARTMRAAREAVEVLMREGLIAEPPRS